MLKHKSVPGIHIQWPWSQMILAGKKKVETRTYPIPKSYIGKTMAIIQTPGPNGKRSGIKSSAIIGTVIFSKCYKYENSSHWESEYDKHLVTPEDPQFNFDSNKEKWAWEVAHVEPLKKPLPPPLKRGITFVKNCKV